MSLIILTIRSVPRLKLEKNSILNVKTQLFCINSLSLFSGHHFLLANAMSSKEIPITKGNKSLCWTKYGKKQ